MLPPLWRSPENWPAFPNDFKPKKSFKFFDENICSTFTLQIPCDENILKSMGRIMGNKRSDLPYYYFILSILRLIRYQIAPHRHRCEYMYLSLWMQVVNGCIKFHSLTLACLYSLNQFQRRSQETAYLLRLLKPLLHPSLASVQFRAWIIPGTS